MDERTTHAMTLTIGEVARMLGVSTKTIRHYHRIGLLEEPLRAPNGYRMYRASDLVTLVRIRQIQALGLNLAEIKRILIAPREERDASVRATLTTLAGALDDQISALQRRRAHLAALLADPALDLSEQPAETPETLRWAQEELGEQLQSLSPALLAQEARLFGLLDAVRWPGETVARLRDMERALAARSESYQRMLAFLEQWAALANERPDSPRVEALIASVRASGALDGASALLTQPGFSAGPTETLLAETLRAALTPAQRRILQALGRALDVTPHGEEVSE
jgi:DNA-binding transcriptional MerR regulator